ncbi:MAG: SagB/ThcOx family dehydrogenase [Nitrospinota bacterium]
MVRTYCYVHRVDGLEPGCYRYLPASHSLRVLEAGDVTAWAAALSLGQALAGNATAAFSLVADLVGAAAAFGNRGYRYAHIESGIIRHGLYLGAEAVGWNATGIGAFYDDDVHRFLDIDRQEGQVVYHHSIGVAVPDDRLLLEGVEPLAAEEVAGQPEKPLEIP